LVLWFELVSYPYNDFAHVRRKVADFLPSHLCGDLTIGVATDEMHRDGLAQQAVERFRRHWACNHIPTDDDLIDVRRNDIAQHCLKRRQVAMDIVQRSNSHN
jgi:hypothetical protein